MKVSPARRGPWAADTFSATTVWSKPWSVSTGTASSETPSSVPSADTWLSSRSNRRLGFLSPRGKRARKEAGRPWRFLSLHQHLVTHSITMKHDARQGIVAYRLIQVDWAGLWDVLGGFQRDAGVDGYCHWSLPTTETLRFSSSVPRADPWLMKMRWAWTLCLLFSNPTAGDGASRFVQQHVAWSFCLWYSHWWQW